MDCYHQVSEDPLLKWVMRVTNLGAGSLVLSGTEWKSMFGVTPGCSSLWNNHRLCVIRCIPEGTTNLVDRIKATVRSIYRKLD